MSIPVDKIGKVDISSLPRSQAGKEKKISGAPDVQLHDQVEISNLAMDLKKLTALVQKEADLRPEKVAVVKNQIETGSYKISPEKIAERMIEEE